MTSLARSVLAISNSLATLWELNAHFPTFDSYVSAYLQLLPPSDDIFLGGWSVGGTIALALAARRLAAGQRVRGVVLLDSYNTAGWRRVSSPPPRPVEDVHCALSSDQFARAHQAHCDSLIGEFAVSTPLADVPVLLVRAGIARPIEEIQRAGFVLPYLRQGAERSVDSGIGGIDVGDIAGACGDKEMGALEKTLFWTRKILPQLDTVTVEGADHYSLMQDGKLCAQASQKVAQWLARIDS